MVDVRRTGRAGRVVGAVVAAALLAGAAAGCGAGSGTGAGAGAGAGEVLTGPVTGRPANLPARVDGAKIVVGDPAAPRTAQVLVDPQCGYCAKFEGTGGEALLKLAAGGKVKVEYLLASFLDRGGAGGSVRAVNALRASVDAGKFTEYRAMVFASRPKARLTDGHLLAIAAEVPGLRGEAFDRAVAEQTYKGWAGDAERAFEATGARGTPMVLVDGRPVGSGDGAMFDAEAFTEALRAVGIGGAAA
ncbi:DsbA family protein [Streptomyces sp. NPDC001194]|uniref:DsbA family protein n=1 Tax=Streptomyces sp. NPDC001194 TaxID=3364547 RepID=UPI0036C1EC8B